VRWQRTLKPKTLSVTHGCNGDRSEGKEKSILPSEEPSDLRRHNYDAVSANQRRNATGMDRGLADEAVVAIKPKADEDMVTYQRIKLSESARKKTRVEAKGGTR
jgi:hypothetical protein